MGVGEEETAEEKARTRKKGNQKLRGTERKGSLRTTGSLHAKELGLSPSPAVTV